MSESESIKADIAFHEKMYFAAIAVLLALIGWISSNYVNVGILHLFLSFLATGFSGAYVVFQYRLIKRLIKELKDV